MEIRIDDAYGQVFIMDDEDNDYRFYASFHALGIKKGALGQKKAVMAELEKSYMLDCESDWERDVMR